MAYAYNTPATGSVKMNIGIKSDGTIARGSEEAAGSKAVSINGIKAAATLAESATVFNKLVGDIIGANTIDSTTAVKTVTYTVVETA